MASIRVLLVEDDVAFARLIQHALAMQDALEGVFDVHPVCRLTDALDALKERAFNIVLLDLNLPDSSGLDTLDVIHEANPMLPIVVLSGMEDPEIEKEALKRGAQQFLRKSNPGDLLEAMRKAIGIRLRESSTEEPEAAGLLNDLDKGIEARNIRREVRKRMF